MAIVPPEGLTVAVPLGRVELIVAISSAGCVMVSISIVEHPFIGNRTDICSAGKPVMVSFVCTGVVFNYMYKAAYRHRRNPCHAGAVSIASNIVLKRLLSKTSYCLLLL